MRQNNVSNWEYDEVLNTMLFFAQRMDELLFHHSTDSYRYPVLSILGLCNEYISVYEDVENELINEKNLEHILEEIVFRLKEDSIAINILSAEYKDRFVKNSGQWNRKTVYENVIYMARKLNNRNYYNGVVDLLRNGINKNTDKRLVDRYSGIFIRVLIDMGYNENYIYNCVHDKFFHSKVSGTNSFEEFLKCFSFEAKTYEVYIGFSMDLSRLVPLFARLRAENIEIVSVDKNSLPTGIKSKGQKTILCFKKVPGLDVYSAYESVREISKVIVNSFGYYNHIKNGIKIYGQVVNGNGKITTISDKDLLKHRVSSLSQEESKINTEKMLDVIFSNIVNLKDISRITEIHNSAIWANSASDSILSLWSVLEKLSASEDGDKINKVKAAIIPFLSSTYIEKIVKTCMLDIKRWDMDFFEQNVRYKEFNDLESTFAFLVLAECEQNRKLLYTKTELYPLLRYRIYFLNAQLKNTKGYMSLIREHEQRVEWQIHRIYRARNYIIHDGRIVHNSGELVINLHTYVDIVFTKIIDLLSVSPYSNDAIEDVMIEHKLNSSIMREKTTNRSKEEIVSSELKRYLYFDEKGGEKDGIDIHIN